MHENHHIKGLMDKESKQNHFKAHLDSLRGIAAFTVIFTHYIGAFFPFVAFACQGVLEKALIRKNFLLSSP